MERSSASAPAVVEPAVKELAAIGRPEMIYAIAYLVAAWAVVVGALIVVRIHPAWWTLLIAFVVISARQQALLNVEHSCIHSTFVRGKKWNERLGILFAAATVGSPYYASRARHLEHHRWLGTDKDPDADLHRGKDKESARGLFKYFFTGLLGGYVIFVLIAVPKVVIEPALRRRDRRNIILGQVAVAIMFFLVSGYWWTYPLLWLLPLGTLTALTHLLRSFVEHAVAPAEMVRYADRLITIHSNPIERFLIAPFNMNYHSEHHRFPGVPAQRLPKLQHQLQAEDPDDWPLMRRSYLAAVLNYVRGLGYVSANA